MATTKKITVKKRVARSTTAKPVKGGEEPTAKKSKIALFWESIPENRFEIVDMDAILE